MTNEAATETDTLSSAIILIGNEILSGRTQDCNLNFLAKALQLKGIRVCEARIIPDDEGVIVECVNKLRSRYGLVFTTGGIGPTHDDITASSVAKAFNVPLEQNPEALALLAAHYNSQEHEMTEVRARMANIPRGAELLHNPVSAAPGFRMGNDYVLPGIPRIMQAIFHELEDRLPSGAPILMRSVKFCSLESAVADSVSEIQKRHRDVEIGSYPFMLDGVPHVSLVAKGTQAVLLDLVVGEMIALARRLGEEPELSDN